MLFFVRYFLLIALFGIVSSLKATHCRAGEITYKWISGYTYSITLVTYTDDGGAVADRCAMNIHFGDGDSCVAYRQNGSLAPASSECPVSYLGVLIQTSPNVKENIFSCTHTYGGQGSYKIYVFDRNRNNGVINVPSSVNQPFYLESLLVIGTNPNNSSMPTVKPLDQAVFNKCFYHNRGSYDTDGDSLSYELVMCKGEDPLLGIGATIPGYTYPGPGSSGTFTIEALHGTITWCKPQQTGEFNIAFITKEWRRAVCSGTYSLVGYVLRDMQILVNNSSNNPPAISVLTGTCVETGTSLFTTVNTSDPDNNVIALTAYGAPFNCSPPNASFSSSAAVNASGNFSWAAACSNIRRQPYILTLKCTDNSSQIALSGFMTQNITVIASAPQNLTSTSGLNTVQLTWNKPSCHPTTSNKISHYNIFRSTTTSTWNHGPCQTGVPASSGLTYIASTFTENDTSMVDYTVISLPNNSNCSYAVVAVYNDCAESYASSITSTQLVIGVEELVMPNYSIFVYPSPAIFNEVTVEISPLKEGYFNLELYDVNGRKLKTLNPTFVKESKSKVVIDLSSFEKGYYFLKVENETKQFVYKPIIKV
jgi:hypothetical protein